MASATSTLVARDVVSPWRKLVGIVARSIAQHFGLRNRRRYHRCYPLGASAALHSARNRARTPLPVYLLINDAPGFHHPWVTRFGDGKARTYNVGVIASFSSPYRPEASQPATFWLHEPKLDGY